MPDYSARPVDEPERQADADRGRGAEHPVDRPRLLAGAERQHARLRRRRPLPGPDRRREAVVRHRPVRLRAWRLPASTRRPGTDPTADLVGWQTLLNAGEPYGGDVAGDRRRDHPAPLVVLHRPLDRPGADADVERVHRRPLPRRRDDPLLQPDQDPVPGRPPGAVLRRLRPPARPRTRPTSRARSATRSGRLDRLLRQGRGLRSPPRASTPTPRPARQPPLPAAPTRPTSWATMAPGEIRLDDDQAKTIDRRRGSDRDRRQVQPGRRRRRLRARPTAPTRPAPPPTGSTRPRRAATR